MQQQAEPGGDGAVFGFLTAVDSPLHGLFGGYLVVDSLGRPLEFHCTAPVKVSRAQQILYGPTPVAAGFTVGAAHVSPHPSDAADEATIRDRLAALAAAVDLREPFERIRAAIEEAQRH